jgi:hypothetical protein
MYERDITNGVVLYSYETPVAAKIDGMYYVTEVKYSQTTNKHINSWTGKCLADTKPQSFFDNL